MEVIIRKAEARDVPRMLALVQELAAFEREPKAVTVTEEHMRDAGFGPDPVWFGWVAESGTGDEGKEGKEGDGKGGEDGKGGKGGKGAFPASPASPASPAPTLLGMAICYVRYSTWKGRRLYLEDIVVTEEARGRRIGERLFMACVQHAVEAGHSGMAWQVLDWNTDAIRFYERFHADLSDTWLNGSLDRDQLMQLADR